MASTAGLIGAGLALVAGSALQLQQAVLWPPTAYAVVAVLALLGGAALRFGPARLRARGEAGRPRALPTLLFALLIPSMLAALTFATTGLRAGLRLAEALPAALEGRDIEVVGVVASLPRRMSQGWRFEFEVASATLDGEPRQLPSRLALSWYASDASAVPDLRAGQRWRLTLRLKRPHGAANPHGFDYELYLFERGLRATGYVRQGRAAHNEPHNKHLAERTGQPVERARQAVRDAIQARVPAPREAGVLAALAVGDQAAIDRADWTLYRETGVAHLMSISGLHVTMFAWLAGLGIGVAWRRSARAARWLPAPHAVRWGGLAAALAYAVFAGWGVPAQRTVMMLAATTFIATAGLRWSWPLVWGSAGVLVTLVDPWALLQPGFWLSFVAVGLLMGSGEARGVVGAANGFAPAGGDAVPHRLRLGRAITAALRTQAVATLGLAPLTLVFFQQLSLVGFVANLVAIPVVTLLITPLALLGVLVPPLWSLAAWAVEVLNTGLGWLAAPGWALWSVSAAPAWAVALGLAGGALALLPLPLGVRVLAASLLLPLLWPPPVRVPPGEVSVLAADVGQGSAVLLRTAGHALLYDTGPAYSAEADAGDRVLVPLLRALGVRRLDQLMLSHRDTDHVGGAASVLSAVPVAALSSSLEAGHPLRAAAQARGVPTVRCEAGQHWTWDGVRFEVLHPTAAALDYAQAQRSAPNALSCVLRVQSRSTSFLLAGDVERLQELALVERVGEGLGSEVLFVPHHGSRTSSSAFFLDAVKPRVAVVQAGYRNRFGHPAPEVLARYRERGIAVVESASCGAWLHEPAGTGCWRALRRRYWQHPGQSLGEEGAVIKPAARAPHLGAGVSMP